MPGITEERKLKLTENKLKYFIKIFSFDHKMKSWRNGRNVHSVPFLVGGTEFEFEIYPNGSNKESRGHVSFFLVNKSEWDVNVEVEVQVGKKIVSDTCVISSKESSGLADLYGHDDLRKDNDAMDDDGSLAVSATISLIWGEVTEERNKSEKDEVEGLKIKFESLEDNLVSKMARLDKSLTAKFKALEVSSKKSSLPGPECPICFEEMKPPTRIIQCRSGHLICQQCKERPQVVICPTCKQEFTGRAFGMENYLKTILD
eukprot:GFUD01022504.1.p1 GENE.GFUD01022504.1~~GFUD01022504.1.p1  ORF type:complete len:259 (+),score=55.79 GFUD01022504.1:46-822(+)